MSHIKVLLTGASGFIGGDALCAIKEAQPTWQVSVLVRDREKAAAIQNVYPDVKIVTASLDDSAAIVKAASQVDVVVHTADSSDHSGAARAIAQGLMSTHTKSTPGYYIHISGTGILTWYDYQKGRYGEPPVPEQAYHDVAGLDAIHALPDAAWHRDVDKIVLEEAAKEPEAVKVAIVPLMIAMTLDRGYSPRIGNGLSEWDNIHVRDLSKLILLLAQQAEVEKAGIDQQEIFGPKGYYFCENGSHKWGEIADVIVREANKRGLVGETSVQPLSVTAAREEFGMEPLTWGLNSKGVAARGQKYLGWIPTNPSLLDSIPNMMDQEIERRKKGLGSAPRVKLSGPLTL